ncbi:MAG TPA: DUF2855 family protein [Acidimicrobiales bacterium]|nr:DUF2855 family protein [Acidimicrobiales bacterium]
MDFEVNRSDLHDTRIVDPPPVELEDGQVRLRVDAFALTANNITYAVAGDMLRYWDVFPAEDPYGRIPVWGYADVVESRHDDLEVGTRWYGYLPMSTELVVEPGRIGDGGFTDTAAHRAGLAGAYNRYVAVPSAPVDDGGPDEDHRMVLYPLFFTSFLIDDAIADSDGFGATQVVISSASSKTALGTAFCLARRGDVEVVGLTSPGNVDFVEGLGVYDRVVAYPDVTSLDVVPSVFVDIAGAAAVRAAVHDHLGDELRHSMTVGSTHWQAPPPVGDLRGPTPQFFFAPTQISKRTSEWGRDELDRRLDEAWVAYATWTDEWIRFEHGAGPEAVERVYRELLDNRADPTVGFVLTMAG